MALAPCPDCGRDVSTAAPACIHCGRPLAAPAPPKPVAGIVIACVLGIMTLAWTFWPREAAATEWGADMRQVSTAVHLLGCSALICGALLSGAGHRAGNTLVRVASWGMILAVLGMMVMGWKQIAPQMAGEHGDQAAGWLALLLGVSTLFGTAQWMLYLYLFRKSKYP